MPLSVKYKLLLLPVGALVAAFALVAGMLVWLIGEHHGAVASQATRALLSDLGEDLAGRQRRLGAGAQALAGRTDIAIPFMRLNGHATAGNNQTPIPDNEKKKLLAELHEYAEVGEADTLGIYDGKGTLLAFEYKETSKETGKGNTWLAGIGIGEQGRRYWVAPHTDPQVWRRLDRPEDIPEQVTEFGPPMRPLTQLRRHERRLLLEAIVPIRQIGEEKSEPTGWLRLSRAVAPTDLEAFARTRHMTADLLFGSDFDVHNRFGLQPEDLARQVPDHPDVYLDAAPLTLAGGEQAWLVAAQERATAQGERQRALGIVLAVLAGSLLVAVPVAGWAGRRWIGAPLDKLRAGVHEYTQGRLDSYIDLHSDDEFGALAEDINLLAVALRVREITIKEAEERWLFALEGAGHGVWDWNPQTGEVFFSAAWKHMLGYEESDIANTLDAWRALVHPDDQAQVHTAVERHFRGETPIYRTSYRILAKDGSYRWVLAIGRVMQRDTEGRAQRMIGTNTDITDRIEAERSIREAATVFDATAEAIMITDTTGLIKRVNPAFTAVTGYTAEETIGRTPHFLKSGRHDTLYYAEMWDTLKSTGHWEGEIWNRRKNGEIFPEWQVISAVKDATGRPVEFVSLFIDITQRKRSEAEIAYRANYDGLTGLPNRSLLAERLGQALKKARREETRVAVMFVDLDFFKQVNDSLGHAAGDRLLQAAAERMRLCVRETDTIARHGGDEFVVLLPDIANNADAAVVAEKIIGQAGAPFLLDGHEIHIGASIGIALFPDDGRDIETLFHNADLAMYRAKDAGRNNAQFFQPERTAA